MEDIDSFWTFQESVDELKQRLQYTTYELELTRKETSEEMRKNNDHIKKLLQLLQTTCKERDEAQTQLRKLQQIMSFNNKSSNNLIDQFNHTTAITAASPAVPFSPDSPLLTAHIPAKTNSSTVTDSSSFSLETQNNININTNNSHSRPQSHVSSPDSCNVVFSTSTTPNTTPPQIDMKPNTKEVDQQSLIIANLAKGRPLPQKGKLLQAVIESGPLLSTLMVAGSLPQWRNPPGVLTHQIPPVDLKGCGGIMMNQSAAGCNKFYTSQPSNIAPQSLNDGGVTNHNNNGSTSGIAAMYNGHGTTSGPFGIFPSSMLEFGGGSYSSGSCFMGGRMMMNSSLGFDCQIPKRQRIL